MNAKVEGRKADAGVGMAVGNGHSVNVNVNGQTQRVPAGATLSDLIAQLGHAPRAIATAVNGDFIACDDRAERVLQGGDQVTCFQAIVGG